MRRFFLGVAMALVLLGSQSLRADDQKIAQQIVNELKAQQAAGHLRGFKIDLTVEDGTVLLKGRVTDAQQQRLALDIARRVEGVKQVVNDLQVQSTTRAGADAHRGPGSLIPWNWSGTSRQAVPERVADSSSRSVLTRRSTSAQPAAAPQAEPTANPAPPVDVQPVHVEPQQQVAAAQPAAPNGLSDDQIARQIYETLQQYKQAGYLHGFRLDMQVHQGTVVLEGQVPQPEQKQLALEVARRVPGVYQVVDMIRVESPSSAVLQTVSTADTSTRRRQPATTERTAPTPASPQGDMSQPVANAAPSALQPIAPVPLQAVPNSAIAVAPQTSAPTAAAPQAPVAVMPHSQPVYHAYQPAAQPAPTTGLPAAAPIAAYYGSLTGGVAQVRYDHPQLPNYAWPSYAAYPNYAAVTYPKQYSPAAWPYIGPFYPYPQVPLGWRKVTLQWDDGWWYLDFKSK